MADIAASVLAKLRNKAKASGISYQQCLQLFVQEEFLRKLSKSGCEDTLILKGGLFIYTLTNFESSVRDRNRNGLNTMPYHLLYPYHSVPYLEILHHY